MSKIVDLEIHKLNDDFYFLSYTAKWCGPCKRIKPCVNEYVNNLIFRKEITQEEFQLKVNKYIPFFIVVHNYKDPENFDTVEKIQTSNSEEFTKFIKKYTLDTIMTIDENF
jgi:thiol-disulfide isomerase/thioredoxin